MGQNPDGNMDYSGLDKAEKRKFDQVSAQVIGSDFEGFAITGENLAKYVGDMQRAAQ